MRADFVLTTRLGLHLVYTCSTLCLHVATMSNDYALSIKPNTKRKTLFMPGCRRLLLQIVSLLDAHRTNTKTRFDKKRLVILVVNAQVKADFALDAGMFVLIA